MLHNANRSLLYSDNILSFTSSILEKEYIIKVTISRDEKKLDVLLYKAAIKWTKTASKLYTVIVSTKDFFINYKEPELMIEVLAAACREPLNNVNFLLNENGTIYSILNYDEILEKWRAIKTDLLLRYGGEIVTNYIYLQDKVINDADLLLDKLKKDMFLHQFFYPLYNSVFVNFGLKVTENSEFLNIPYELPVVFLAKNEGRYDEKNELEFEKKLDMYYYNSEQMPVEKYEGVYRLNKDHSIKAIDCIFQAFGQIMVFKVNELDTGLQPEIAINEMG